MDADPITSAIAVLRQESLATDADARWEAQVRAVGTLIAARFLATAKVEEAIDAERASDAPVLPTLYFVLGATKDPVTIAWLRERLHTTHAQHVRGPWIAGWRRTVRGRGNRWISGRDRWRDVILDIYSTSAAPFLDRSLVYVDLPWCMSDPRVLVYYSELAENAPSAGDFVRVAAVLHVHGGSVNISRLEAECEALKLDAAGQKELAEYAPQLPNAEKLVPWLIDALAACSACEPERLCASIEKPLRSITFARGVAGAAAWRSWYTAHERCHRDEWVEESLDGLTHLLPEGYLEVEKALRDNRWAWHGTPGLVPYVNAWSADARLHGELTHLVVLLPYGCRDQVRPAIDNIMAASSEGVVPGSPYTTREWLRDCGIIEDPADTWQKFVKSVYPRRCAREEGFPRRF